MRHIVARVNDVTDRHEIEIINLCLSVWLALIVFGPVSPRTAAVVLGYLTLWGLYARGHWDSVGGGHE